MLFGGHQRLPPQRGRTPFAVFSVPIQRCNDLAGLVSKRSRAGLVVSIIGEIHPLCPNATFVTTTAQRCGPLYYASNVARDTVAGSTQRPFSSPSIPVSPHSRFCLSVCIFPPFGKAGIGLRQAGHAAGEAWKAAIRRGRENGLHPRALRRGRRTSWSTPYRPPSFTPRKRRRVDRGGMIC